MFWAKSDEITGKWKIAGWWDFLSVLLLFGGSNEQK
jgi:hypothetical protein